ncbi:MAG: penicillin-binding transpeptidase domain-containing protein [Solirubrobacteraceae bacterium]
MAQSVLTGSGARRRRSRRRRRRRPIQRRWRKPVQRRWRLTRAIPIVVLAAAAFAAGVLIATAPGRDERHLVSDYVQAWSRDDYARMYALLDGASRARLSEARFASAYRNAATTATLLSISPGRVGNLHGGAIAVRMAVATRLFGTLRETLSVPLTGSGSSARVHVTDQVLFPGLRPGERLRRDVALAPRASLLASDGTPLAQGPTRSSPIPDVASQVVGTLRPIPAADRARYAAAGYPPNAKIGIDGLERIFQRQLAGTPGGTLLAGKRVLARRAPVAGVDVKTTIDPTIERAAITAIAGRYAAMAAIDPRTGAVRALVNFAFSVLQPPGSTMKIITATAALQAGIVKLSDTFPVATSSTIDGYTLQNAGGEACGGTLLNAFAVSCNSVFAPLGARLGAQPLVAMAQRFGFNQPPSIEGAAESQIPSAATIGDALAVGSSAIGQGRVQASTLEMTDVAATIAMGGRRPVPTLLAGQRPRFVRVASSRVAHEVQQMMVAVVQFGTGTAAQIPGVQVAGKTGTAELTDTASPGASSPQNTDAWFVGYAPVGHPRIVVGALFPAQGGGGATAAPPVHDVLVAALQGH